MTLKAIESFDRYANLGQVVNRRGFLQWTIPSGYSAVSLVPGRYNSAGQAISLAGSGSTLLATLAENFTSLFIGMGVNYNLINYQAQFIFGETAGGTTKVTVSLNPDGSITYPGGRTGANVLPQSSWFFLEIGIVVGATGSVIVKVNNQAVVSATGINTAGTGAADINLISFGNVPANNGGITIDDIYINDGAGAAPYDTFLGDNRVYALSVNAAGDSTQWTPSAGANYQNVENVGSTFNSSATPGQTDLFKLTGLPSNVTSVLAIQVTGVYAKTDATSHTIQQLIKSGGTVANGTGFLSPYSVTNSELFYSDDPIVNDPATGLPFTLGALAPGSIQIGYSLAS